jgi:hypothetical protein
MIPTRFFYELADIDKKRNFNGSGSPLTSTCGAD